MTEKLEGKSLEVTVDTEFPRIIQYRVKADGSVMDGQAEPATAVELNGKPAQCKVTFRKLKADAAEYRLSFPNEGIEATLKLSVGENHVEMTLSDIKEGATKLKSISFPGNSLLTASSSQPDSSIATLFCTCMHDQHIGVFREKIDKLSSIAPCADTGNYFFISNGKVAAGIGNNHFRDIQRIAYKVEEKDGVKTCSAWAPVWQYREIDTEPLEIPCVRIFVTSDRNGDGKTDWQDAALAYRSAMPKPFGHEFVRTTVGENIAMNFASGAQQPFLKILDEVKKIYLATDGIGNQVVIKGFSSEGHDSANTDCAGHWNERAGGLKDFNVLLSEAHKYNARIGIHINASEVYPEAHRYKPEILQRDGNGNPKGGWAWLDHAHMIDKAKDTTSGQLFATLDQMRKDLPGLDMVYVDTYWENGWPAWKIAAKLNSLGLPIYTEGDMPLDPWTTWSHWRGSGASRSPIMRFLSYSDRDIFGNDPILRGGRSDEDGFMGWQNQHNFNSFIHATFSRNLPAKYLQNFELLKWEPGKQAVFSDGVKVVKDGDNVTVTQDNRVVMTWTGGGSNSRLFVPWDPKTAPKIYAWDETGSEQTWTLPPSWKDCKEVYLYRLSDTGRGDETKIQVADGKITLKIEKGVPYVVYPKQASAQKPIAWSEGSPVKDSGFDSHGFSFWKCGADLNHIKIENDNRGNSRLVISGNDGAAGEVSQDVKLEAGKTYAASVWVQVGGERETSIVITDKQGKVLAGKTVKQTNIRHSAPNDSRSGTNYQRLRVVFIMPAGITDAKIILKSEKGAASSSAEFDEVRIIETKLSPEAAKHYCWEDFENVETGGYGPFACCPDEHTHLSETNKYTIDTINGQFSLKTRGGGRVLRTIPSSLYLKPNTNYSISCETLASQNGNGRFTVESKGKVLAAFKISGGRGKVTGEFSTGSGDDSYISLFKDGGDMLVIDDFAIDELGRAPKTEGDQEAVDRMGKREILFQEEFDKQLGTDWSTVISKNPGSKLAAGNGRLEITAAANVSVIAEHKIPAGITAAECNVNGESEEGQTWGIGLALVWKDGKALRINLRGPDGKFGIDSTAEGQSLVGSFGAGEVTLRIRLETDKVFVEARNEDDSWQDLAAFPREKFPGEPEKLRIGKMHGVEGVDDHSDPGKQSTVSISKLKVYGKPQ